MSEYLKAIILGLVQGLTEFLPVSSSGHIEIFRQILGFDAGSSLQLMLVLHFATSLSTVVAFWKDISAILIDLIKFKWNANTKFALFIIVSMIPAGLVGVFFKDEVEAMMADSLLLVGFMLIVTSALLYATTRLKSTAATEVGFFQSLIIGFAQAFAIAPGLSRSGSTIATSLLIGVDKAKAAKFSFMMSIPVILGAGLVEALDMYKSGELADAAHLGPLFVGAIFAFISGLLACKWMISIVKKGKLTYFAYYTFAIGLGVILFVLLGRK